MKKLFPFIILIGLFGCAHGPDKEFLSINHAVDQWEYERDLLDIERAKLKEQYKVIQEQEIEFLNCFNEDQLEAYANWHKTLWKGEEEFNEAQLRLDTYRLRKALDDEQWVELFEWLKTYRDYDYKAKELNHKIKLLNEVWKIIEDRVNRYTVNKLIEEQKRRDLVDLFFRISTLSKLSRIERELNQPNWIYQSGKYHFYR